MLKNIVTAALIAICLGSGAANAAAPTLKPKLSSVWTSGNLDCGSWIMAREAKMSQAIEDYIVGLMNGLALGREVELWHAKGATTQEQVFLWFDNYCRMNPLSNPTGDGARKLADELSDGDFSREAR